VYVGLKRFDNPATGALVALDAVTGEEQWRHPFSPELETQPAGCLGGAVANETSVFVSADDGRVYSLFVASGEEEWVAGRVISPTDPGSTLAGDLRPVTLANGRLIAGSQATGILTAYELSTGEEQWQSSADRGGTRYPLSDDDDAVYVLHLGGQLAALESTGGALLWRAGDSATGPGAFVASPAVDTDRLYLPGRQSLMALAK
jgi:outer membrane protein assembly factor BamB